MTKSEFEKKYNHRYADNCANCKSSDISSGSVCEQMKLADVDFPYISSNFVCDLFERWKIVKEGLNG